MHSNKFNVDRIYFRKWTIEIMERHVLTPEQLNATTICWILCEQIDPRWGSLVNERHTVKLVKKYLDEVNL